MELESKTLHNLHRPTNAQHAKLLSQNGYGAIDFATPYMRWLQHEVDTCCSRNVVQRLESAGCYVLVQFHWSLLSLICLCMTALH
eukprot:6475373-Amphidinium_carterae.1